MDKNNIKKNEQLGMPHGTAANRLRKMVMFDLVKKAGLDVCFQCNNKIETVYEFSIEHKTPWLDSADPLGLYFSLDNISFSHLNCNVANSRQPFKKGEIISAHGSMNRYDKWGCRCNSCKETKRKRNAKRVRL